MGQFKTNLSQIVYVHDNRILQSEIHVISHIGLWADMAYDLIFSMIHTYSINLIHT